MAIICLDNPVCLHLLHFFVIIAPAFADSVVIIEVELNPSGTDAGNEWIKLFNFDSKPIDLSGWKVLTDDGRVYYF